jgi:hypothetical protein
MLLAAKLGQLNLIDRLSSPSTPQNLARPNFFYFVKIKFSGKFWCPTLHLYFKFYFRLEMSRTHVRSIK